MKFLKQFENFDFYKGYTSSFTDTDNEYKLDGQILTLDELQELFNSYKNTYEENYDIQELEKLMKNDLDDLYKKMYLDTFLNSLEQYQEISKSKSINYFNKYIEDIPRKYRKLYKNDYSDYEKEKYNKLKKIKKSKKNKQSEKIFKKESQALLEELSKMVLWVKENKKKVLITFDGRDTAGKGSLIKFLLYNFFASPLGRNIKYKDFGIPSKYEQRNWFFRYKKNLPKEGEVILFDRSWYNRAVNDIVMGYCTKNQYYKFMDSVIPFEESLENRDIIHIKFWLSIEKETQEFRFNKRINNPLKSWKFSQNDVKSSKKWDEFTFYINRMFEYTSTPDKPWVITNMDDKYLGFLNTLRYILNKVPYENKNEKILKMYPEITYEILK